MRCDRWVVALLVLVAALAVAACAGAVQTPVAASAVVSSPASAAPSVAPVVTPSAAPSGSGAPSGGPGSSGSPAFVPDSPVAGVVTAVQMNGTTITGFTLHTNDGETLVFKIGVLQNADDFPASQLQDYETTGAPILVFFNQTGSDLVVFRIEDAG